MPETDKFIGVTFAGCRITAKIGHGGMGSVYTARQESLNKIVAVKLLAPELASDERNIEFFLREARAIAKLEHPNIVQVYNFGQENGAYFIVMSYIEGKSLESVIAENGPLAPDIATDIILEVLAGLGHAHSHTIIHRDIKPSNILLDPCGHPKIVDFGLARSITEEKQLTMAGEMVGTAYFMSPEQGLAGKVDHRADLYSTGGTYFYLLTGKYPFEGKNSIEVIHKHIGQPFPSIIRLKPDIPLWIAGVLEHLMRKKPEDRYQNAAQVIDEIKRLRTAEKDGTAVSNARDIEMSGLSEHFAAEAAGSPAQPLPAKTAAAAISAPAAPPRGKTLKNKNLRLPALTALHFAVTSAAIGCFLLAGSLGTPKPGLALLFSPFAANPSNTGFLLAAGLALSICAVIIKPLKLTLKHFFFSAAASLTAYTGGIYVPSPGTSDMVSKAFFCLSTAVENMFSPANLLCYSLFLFLIASKIVFRPQWWVKIAAIAAYGMSLLLTCSYFKGQPVSGDLLYPALAGAAALAGLASALTQKRITLIFNPVLFFLAANALIIMIFATPQISAITERMILRDAERVQELRSDAQLEYRRERIAQTAAMPEFDLEGRPIEKNPVAKPAEITPAPREEILRAARVEYFRTLAFSFKNEFLNTAGLIFLAFFLLFAANICFMDETLKYYNQQDFTSTGG